MSSHADEYPHLFQEYVWPWGPTQARFRLLRTLPPKNLISNINLVPTMGSQWIILRLADGSWEIPGGTLEPGEDYLAALRRELLEEAGARLVSFHLFGAWNCHSLADKPYRQHLPFPDFYRVVGWGEIELTQSPQVPTSGEKVTSVVCDSLESVVTRFSSVGRQDLAELYQLAASLQKDYGDKY